MNLCAQNATKCTEFETLASCPSRYGASYDPRCNMQKTLKQCGNAAGAMVESCRTDMNWIVANMVKSSSAGGTTGTASSGTTGSTTGSTGGTTTGTTSGMTGVSTTTTGQVSASGAKRGIFDG